MPLTAFAVATLALNLAPGPDMTYVAARSVGQGRRAGVVSALGISAGCLVHIAAAAGGLAVLLAASPRAYDVLRLCGAAYLMYLGLRMFVRAGRARLVETTDPASNQVIFRQGFITNVLNPKVAMFFVAFLPQFIEPSRGPAGAQVLALGLFFNASGTVVNLTVAWLAGSLRLLLQSARGRGWFERVSGVVLVALGVRLALTRAAS